MKESATLSQELLRPGSKLQPTAKPQTDAEMLTAAELKPVAALITGT
jgi:hypothetical protein